MSKPCGQLPSKPPVSVNVCFPWQDAPLPVALQVYQSGGGGLSVLASSAALAGAAVAARAAATATATAPRIRGVMAPPLLGLHGRRPRATLHRCAHRSCVTEAGACP